MLRISEMVLIGYLEGREGSCVLYSRARGWMYHPLSFRPPMNTDKEPSTSNDDLAVVVED